jgi:hypothetical protein
MERDLVSDRQLDADIEMLCKERARRQHRDRDNLNEATAGAGNSQTTEAPWLKSSLAGISTAPAYDLDNLFTYHPPSGRQLTQYEAIRTAAKYFGLVILQNTPGSADQATAIRKLRECVMTANASIALS